MTIRDESSNRGHPSGVSFETLWSNDLSGEAPSKLLAEYVWPGSSGAPPLAAQQPISDQQASSMFRDGDRCHCRRIGLATPPSPTRRRSCSGISDDPSGRIGTRRRTWPSDGTHERTERHGVHRQHLRRGSRRRPRMGVGTSNVPSNGDEVPLVQQHRRLSQVLVVWEARAEHVVVVEGVATFRTPKRAGRHQRWLRRLRHRRLWPMTVSAALVTAAHRHLFRRLPAFPVGLPRHPPSPGKHGRTSRWIPPRSRTTPCHRNSYLSADSCDLRW